MHTRLRALREGRVYSQAGLAQAAGVDEKTVARLERGEGVPHPATLRKLAAALGVPPWELLADADAYAAARRRRGTAQPATP